MQRRDVMRTAAAGMAGLVGGQVLGMDTAGAGTTDAGGPHGGPPGRSPLSGVELVFLAHVNDPATTTLFPGDPEFRLTTMTTVAEDGYYMRYVEEGEHTGTHWGAPAHFQEGGLTADQLDPHDLFLPAAVVDVRDRAAADADYGVTVADLRAFERRHGRIPRGAAVILWTGWAERWGTDAYANLDADGVIHQPGFTLEAAEWLVERRKLDVRGALGTDTFSPDRGVDSDYGVSVLLYQEHRISLENLTNLGALPPLGAHVLVGGPINAAGSGSTAMVYGLVPPRRR
jgi:kynurenine formamidase